MTCFILKPNMLRLVANTRPLLVKAQVSTQSGPWMGVAQAAGSGSDEQSRFLQALETYSAYTPSPVSLQHFIDFAKSANPESSFKFLKQELPTRLANIMKELQLLPPQLHETHACKVIKD